MNAIDCKNPDDFIYNIVYEYQSIEPLNSEFI